MGDWLEEIHAEKTGDKGDRHEQGGDDGEGLHDFVHAVVHHRQVGIQRSAHQVAQALVEVVQADEVVVYVAEEDAVFGVYHAVIVARQFVEHFALGQQDAPHCEQYTFERKQAFQGARPGAVEYLVFDLVDGLVHVFDQGHVTGHKIVDDLVQQVVCALLQVADVAAAGGPGFIEGRQRVVVMRDDEVGAEEDVQFVYFGLPLAVVILAQVHVIQDDVEIIAPVVYFGGVGFLQGVVDRQGMEAEFLEDGFTGCRRFAGKIHP